ncbi:MAG TPA: hypothetical protein VHF25_07205 [Nitriliruptorales bacterium]|nr:hypothetical protein [Nitriliruptorales bacterium]
MDDARLTIRTACSTCHGEVELSPSEIKLVLEPTETRSRARHGRYAFVCPQCVTIAVEWADASFVELLTQRGVEVIGHDAGPSGTRRRTGRHPEHIPAGPPLTVDDLLDFHLLLQRPDWFQRLLQLV